MPTSQSNRRLESLPSAAEYAGVSVRTLRRYIADGRVRAYRVGPRLIKVDLADLDAMLRPIGGAA
ncbi:MAG: helix-turn-helix domain-containing protein [Gordonia polyisoprenivorans]|nr:helix-turn-helix domain-containing protein [Gordonia polyisoprenivorans]